eukprot:CCRYP_008583-RC/>CCRYP_008583-RC protein AED:0.21 eAED:0.21 QI:408/1/1/1/0.5/0.33/3/247/1254
MWYFDRNVEDSSLDRYNEAVRDMRSSPSVMTSSDSERSDTDENASYKVPLPCPCSESTLESHSSHSNCVLLDLEEDCQPSQTSASSQLSRDNNEQHLCRRAARQVLKGIFAGSVLSLLFVAPVVLLAPKSTVRWVGSMHHRIKPVNFPMIKEIGITWRQRLKQDKQSLSSNNSVTTQRLLRDSRQTENEITHNSTKLGRVHQAPTSLAMKESLIHDVELDGQLVQDFFRRPRKPHVYHSAETTTSNDTSPRFLQRQSRMLQSSSSFPNSDTSSSTDTNPSPSDSAVPNTPPKDPQLVVAGKLTVADGPCNVAQMNLKTGEWSLQQRIQLSLYNSYSGGEVYSLLANHTITTNSNAKEFRAEGASSKGSVDRPHVMDTVFGNELIVVGAFDTTYRNSQTTYCSVGKWDGSQLSKIGEGLCNSALSRGMKITSAAIAGPNDVFVAGSFQTQVWNGEKHEFVKIFNIAHFNAIDQVWLPLPVGQITCSWCTVTILALAWDSDRRQLHVAGKFNAIDGNNIPAGLAVYDQESGHLVAHPGGGLTMKNATEDGVGTAIQLDQESGVLYVMGAFERLTATGQECLGLAAYEIKTNSWTCLADPAHSVLPTGGGNMLLTPYGLLVAGKTTPNTTWPDSSRPYTIAVLKATIKKKVFIENSSTEMGDSHSSGGDESEFRKNRRLRNETSHIPEDMSNSRAEPDHEFIWSWLPGFDGHDEPIHTLSNGFGDYVGTVFIGGDNFISKWSYKTVEVSCDIESDPRHPTTKSRTSIASSTCTQKTFVPVTVDLSQDKVQGAIMAISQLDPLIRKGNKGEFMRPNVIGYTIVAYCVTLGAVIGMFFALMCNKSLSQTIMSFIFDRDAQSKGISLDTLTYGTVKNTNVAEAYHRAMSNRFVKHPHLLTLIDPQEIILHRIIGEGTFGRVWSAKWGNASVAVKEFVFAQAAVAGKSRQQQAIVEEIIGEAGMMAILRHPNVLQLFGCSLTAQAIWIVSELCSLGSLRQVLDDRERTLPMDVRLNLALQVAEGMSYLHTQDPPIIHRDLKSHNIFVHETFAEVESKDKSNDSKQMKWLLGKKNDNSSSSESGSGNESEAKQPKTKVSMSAKIGDWGSARASLAGSRTMTHGVGTACWMAPEVLKHARSSKYSDVYGFGIVLWELATRREVYEGLESTQIIAMVANDHLRPEVPAGCPWNDLMVKCWREVPNERPHFEEIVKELNRLKPVVKTSTYKGESLKIPNWKIGVTSYQKGEAPPDKTGQKKRRTG